MRKTQILRFADDYIDSDILMDIIFSPAVSSVNTFYFEGELLVRVYFYDDTTVSMLLDCEV